MLSPSPARPLSLSLSLRADSSPAAAVRRCWSTRAAATAVRWRWSTRAVVVPWPAWWCPPCRRARDRRGTSRRRWGTSCPAVAGKLPPWRASWSSVARHGGPPRASPDLAAMAVPATPRASGRLWSAAAFALLLSLSTRAARWLPRWPMAFILEACYS
ncbi:hypothetical protein PVAP13_5NG392281 [Panicum virgatum]|nr:hypothetical protein PVAP13_5NG392281 [Panicum virgatum]